MGGRSRLRKPLERGLSKANQGCSARNYPARPAFQMERWIGPQVSIVNPEKRKRKAGAAALTEQGVLRRSHK